MSKNNIRIYDEATKALDDLEKMREMLKNPIVIASLVTNFHDCDGSISLLLMDAANFVGEYGLSIGLPDDSGSMITDMKGLWINRWPVDLTAFWEQVYSQDCDFNKNRN